MVFLQIVQHNKIPRNSVSQVLHSLTSFTKVKFSWIPFGIIVDPLQSIVKQHFTQLRDKKTR